jgi:hypothetical protein
MSHRDNSSIIKKYKELFKPMDLMNVGFVGTAGGGGDPFIVATGGSVSAGTIDGNYKYHVFYEAQSGTAFNVTAVGDSPYNEVEYLVVAGGGMGASGGPPGGGNAGGGGAGGFRTATGHVVTVKSYNITVGSAGPHLGQGGSSVFDTITSAGGGGGGNTAVFGPGVSGGSGGGEGGSGNIPATSPAQGHNGYPGNGGGGGGAGSAGSGTSGGSGRTSSIRGGSGYTYAIGGGGAGSSSSGNYGSGGTGGVAQVIGPGPGKPGIVVIRYQFQ